jgi:hypothetical protein
MKCSGQAKRLAASALLIRLGWGKIVRRHVALVEFDLDDAHELVRLGLVSEDGGQRGLPRRRLGAGTRLLLRRPRQAERAMSHSVKPNLIGSCAIRSVPKI